MSQEARLLFLGKRVNINLFHIWKQWLAYRESFCNMSIVANHLDHQKTLKISILKPDNLSLALKAVYKIKTCHQDVFSNISIAQEHNVVTATVTF